MSARATSSNAILEALIDRRLWENNPTKYKRLQREGILNKWVRSQAEQAQRAIENFSDRMLTWCRFRPVR